MSAQGRTRALAMLAALTVGCGGAPQPPPEIGSDGLPVIDTETPLPEPLPTVAARVNGEDVQTRNVIIIAEARLRRKEIDDKVVAYRRALQEVIARELLLQEALSRGITPDPDRLQQVYDENRAGYRDDASWNLFLGQEGLDEELFRKELRVQHTVNALIAQIVDGQPIEATDAEARAFYDENPEVFDTGPRLRARHILVRVTEGSSEQKAKQAVAEIHTVRRRLVAGEDFGALAAESSDDAGTRGRGGELQVFSRSEVPPAFAARVFDLEPGELSAVFRSSAGYHVAEVLERLPSERLAFDDVREGLKQRLAAQRRQQQIQRFVNELRNRARIVTFL